MKKITGILIALFLGIGLICNAQRDDRVSERRLIIHTEDYINVVDTITFSILVPHADDTKLINIDFSEVSNDSIVLYEAGYMNTQEAGIKMPSQISDILPITLSTAVATYKSITHVEGIRKETYSYWISFTEDGFPANHFAFTLIFPSSGLTTHDGNIYIEF